MENETKLYEIGYLLLPMLAEETLAAEVATLRALVEKHGGVVQSAELPKSRQLAYTVGKKIANKRSEFNQAYFGTMLFRALPEAAPAIKSDFDKQDNVLRFMLIETVPYEAPVRRAPREEGEAAPVEAAATPVERALVEEKPAKEALTSEDIDKEVEGLIAKAE
ncbi:MAG: hypothetical protein A2542_02830 [Parcubacteria group bacterium RIFOXYD2_FULL_52_8]|nr:MAG: hypothetical protein A2542_02830 [Parcubacteria group bacterium RIFOXYD2_FULL_52_8]